MGGGMLLPAVPYPKGVLRCVGSTVLFASHCEGIHAAAIGSTADVACPQPQTFIGVENASAATSWAEAVPENAMVLLAVVNLSEDGKDVDTVLQALSQGGLS